MQHGRNWPRYAHILDLHLAGLTLSQIAEIKGLSRERVRQIVVAAKFQLARRVFKGLPRYRWRWIERGRYVATR
jgi:hypothetical protein